MVFSNGGGFERGDWLEQMRGSFVPLIGSLTVAPVPLPEVIQACKARWPVLADYEDTALEALLGLWPEIRVNRTSIFDAVVEVSRPGLQDREEAGVPGGAGPLAEGEGVSALSILPSA